LTEAAARGAHDLFYLDQCGFAPALPLRYTWAREGTRPLARYEAPQGRRVNVLGAFAPFGPHPRLLHESRVAGQRGEGRLDAVGLLDFVCREIIGLRGPRGGYAALDQLAADPSARAAARRAVPATIALDNYGVHHSKVVTAALPTLAALGVSFYYLPPYSPKLNRIEPEWHALKYHRLADCSFTSGPSLKAAVEAALDERAAEFAPTHSTNHLLEAA
jgi:putative transposase